MTSIPIETSGLPEKLSTIPPAKLAKTVQAIQKWTGDAFVKIADMVKAVTLAEAQSTAVLARLTTITTEEQYAEYIQVLKVAKGKAKEFEGSRLEITKPVNDAISRVNDLAKDGKVGWDRVAAKVEGFTAAYRIEKQRKADIEAARIRQAQIKQQEEDRRKAEKLAVKAEAKGNVEQAQVIRETAEVAATQPVAAVTVEAAIPDVSGHHTRRYWHATVTNLALVPDRWILKTVNLKALEDHAKDTEGQVPVPGVAFSYEDKDIVRT
jgi:hypothetical protein